MDDKKIIRRYNNGVTSIWVFFACTLLNVFLVCIADMYFIFSSHIITNGIYILEKMGANMFEVFIVAFMLDVPMLICAIFARKHWGFMAAALVLAAADLIFLAVDYLPLLYIFETSQVVDIMINIVIHAILVIEILIAVLNNDAIKIQKRQKEVMEMGVDAVSIEYLPSGEAVYVLSDAVNNASIPGEFREQTEENAAKRKVTISRKKMFTSSLIRFEVIIDGVLIGSLKNGESLSVMVSQTSHALLVQGGQISSDVLNISAGSEDKNYLVKPLMKGVTSYITIDEVTSDEDL